MDVKQEVWRPETGWSSRASEIAREAHLVLLFGARGLLARESLVNDVRQRYPMAKIAGCSTAGEISGESVLDDSVVATAVRFAHTRVRLARAEVSHADNSREVGEALARALIGPQLNHVMVFSDGLNVNGTLLAAGLSSQLPNHVAVTGGLAGDGDQFERTLVCDGEGASDRCVVAVGFYGDRLRVGYGSLGGWDSFGPLRQITRSEGNVLLELDGQSALTLYKQYLGEHATALPSSALLFPLALRQDGVDAEVVRTVLSIDAERGSMTFAGDMPQGAHARLMKANFDRLIDGAAGAARAGVSKFDSFKPELAVLISCVGRKLVLKQRIEEEVEGVRDAVGDQAVLAGFYSYGEICPHGVLTRCELHNQTMTVTTFCET